MIKDIFIIKDGLPVLSEHKQKQESTFSDNDELVMMSGFLSALDSFSQQFDKLGSISQLKLTNDLKISFMRDAQIENLIYVASSDVNTDDYCVQKVLKKISNTFLNRCNAQMMDKWRGKSTYFEEIQEELSKIVNEADCNAQKTTPNKNQYSTIKPISRIDSTLRPERYLSGEKAKKIFKEINGNSSITDIATKLCYDEREVFNICKSLMKMSLISFTG